MSRSQRAPWLLALVGAALAVTLVIVAEPASIWGLARRATLAGLIPAAAWAAAIVVCRGLRLALVVGPPLSLSRGVAVSALSQFAVGVLPMRLGELALVPLLAQAGLPGAMRGLSFLLLLRALDLAALIVVGLCAVALLGAPFAVAVAASVAALAASGATFLLAARWLPRLARTWRHRRGLRRRIVFEALQVRRQVRVVARSRVTVALVLGLSVAGWLGVWGMSIALLRAIGLGWGAGLVFVGMVGASLAAAVPVNFVGNFGTLEAGWTAALAAQGIAPQTALAAGFVTHLWSLAFTTLLAAVAAVYLWRSRSVPPLSDA